MNAVWPAEERAGRKPDSDGELLERAGVCYVTRTFLMREILRHGAGFGRRDQIAIGKF